MTIKEVKCWETSDGRKHNTYEAAIERENEVTFYEMFDFVHHCYGISLSELWSVKNKLIQFFVDKGYVKEIKIGVN